MKADEKGRQQLEELSRRVGELERYRQEREEAEEALLESEGRFRSLVEHAADAVFIHDLDGRLLDVNQRACESLGYACPELLKLSVRDIELNFESEKIEEKWKAMTPGVPMTLQGMHRRKDGSVFPVEVRIGLIQYSGQRFVLALARDITERRQAEEALAERARHAALGADVGFALTRGTTLREALQGCAEAMVRHLDAAFARIWTLNPAGDVLELQASAGIYTHTDGAHGRIPVGRYKIGVIAQERMPHLTNSVIGDPLVHDQEWAKREGMVAFAGHPLIVGDKVSGVAAMFSRKPLSEATLVALGSVADVITLGIERIRAVEALKESEARFRSLVEESMVGAYVIQDRRFAYINRRFSEIFGYSKEELEGIQSLFELVHPEDRLFIQEIMKKRESGEIGVTQHQFRGLRKDNNVVWLEALGWSTSYGGRRAAIGTLLDVTGRKRAEEEKAAVFNMLTHDIKGPLTVITGYAEVLQQKGAAGEDAAMLKEITKAAERINLLINDMLELSKIESGMAAPELEPVSLPELVREAVAENEMCARELGLDVTVDADVNTPVVNADRKLLARAIGNLLANAANYNVKGGRVSIRCGQPTEGGETAFIEVSDTGVGIPSEDLPRIFDRYYRCRKTGQRIGTGLGLAVVKAVVEAHGGNVTVESQEGEGSTFRVELPVSGRP